MSTPNAQPFAARPGLRFRLKVRFALGTTNTRLAALVNVAPCRMSVQLRRPRKRGSGWQRPAAVPEPGHLTNAGMVETLLLQ